MCGEVVMDDFLTFCCWSFCEGRRLGTVAAAGRKGGDDGDD
jgi:hypothetical protein